MTEEFKRDIRAFLNSLAGECANCFRRANGYCDQCYSNRAKILLQRLDMNDPVDNPALRCDIVSRMARIAAILKKARRPLMSVEIDMADYGTRSKKEFTLLTMIRLGKIERKPIGGGKYVYFLTNHTSKKDKQNG